VTYTYSPVDFGVPYFQTNSKYCWDSCGKVIKIPCHGNSNIVDVYKFQTSMD